MCMCANVGGSTSFFVAVPKVPKTILEIRSIFSPLEEIEDQLLRDTLASTPLKISDELIPQIISKIITDEGCPFDLLAKSKRVQAHYKKRPPSNQADAYRAWYAKFEELTQAVHKDFLQPWLEAHKGQWLLHYAYHCSEWDCSRCVLEQGDHWKNVEHITYSHR